MDTVRGVWVSPSGNYVVFHERAAFGGDRVVSNKENDEENRLVENDSQKKNKDVDSGSITS
jgi:hypothetical protein